MYFDLYTPRWHSDVVRLADKVFGEGYFVRPSEIAAEPGSVIFIGQEKDEMLLGFAQGRVLPQGGLQDHMGGMWPTFRPKSSTLTKRGRSVSYRRSRWRPSAGGADMEQSSSRSYMTA